MNASLYAIIYFLINKICFSGYLRYIVLSCHLNLAIISKVYIPSYNYHEALGYDLIFIGLKIFIFSFQTYAAFVT